jgi:hypothetical protein
MVSPGLSAAPRRRVFPGIIGGVFVGPRVSASAAMPMTHAHGWSAGLPAALLIDMTKL